jgi:hypothetical protein
MAATVSGVACGNLTETTGVCCAVPIASKPEAVGGHAILRINLPAPAYELSDN